MRLTGRPHDDAVYKINKDKRTIKRSKWDDSGRCICRSISIEVQAIQSRQNPLWELTPLCHTITRHVLQQYTYTVKFPNNSPFQGTWNRGAVCRPISYGVRRYHAQFSASIIPSLFYSSLKTFFFLKSLNRHLTSRVFVPLSELFIAHGFFPSVFFNLI